MGQVLAVGSSPATGLRGRTDLGGPVLRRAAARGAERRREAAQEADPGAWAARGRFEWRRVGEDGGSFEQHVEQSQTYP